MKNGGLFLSFSETPSVTGDNTQHNLPVTFDTIEDPSVNNLTRSDANCDKTGTCYDGMNITRIIRSFLLLTTCRYLNCECVY